MDTGINDRGSLRAGDEVLIRFMSLGVRSIRLGRVERLTKTLIVLEGGDRFTKINGWVFPALGNGRVELCTQQGCDDYAQFQADEILRREQAKEVPDRSRLMALAQDYDIPIKAIRKALRALAKAEPPQRETTCPTEKEHCRCWDGGATCCVCGAEPPARGGD